MIRVVTPPMPGTVSESMGPYAERVLNCGFHRSRIVLEPKAIFEATQYKNWSKEDILSYDKIDMTRRVAQAPVPYSGSLLWHEPRYVWTYYMDHTGEHYVAEEATLELYPRGGFPFEILGDHV